MNPASQRLPVGSVAWLEINLRPLRGEPCGLRQGYAQFRGAPGAKAANHSVCRLSAWRMTSCLCLLSSRRIRARPEGLSFHRSQATGGTSTAAGVDRHRCSGGRTERPMRAARRVDACLQKGIVLCQDLCKNEKVLETLELSRQQKDEIIAEASFACGR